MKESIRWVKLYVYFIHVYNLRKIICQFIKYIIFNPFVYSDFYDAASVSKLMILATNEIEFSYRKILF